MNALVRPHLTAADVVRNALMRQMSAALVAAQIVGIPQERVISFMKGGDLDLWSIKRLADGLDAYNHGLEPIDDDDDSAMFWAGTCGFGFASRAILPSENFQERPPMMFGERPATVSGAKAK